MGWVGWVGNWNFVVIGTRSGYHQECCPDLDQVGHLVGSIMCLSAHSTLVSGLTTFNASSN